jgi:hypothetical protein
MLWDNGLYWVAILVLTTIFTIFFGLYNREAENEKNRTLLVLGWIFLGIDLLVLGVGLYQALFYKKTMTVIL